MALRGDLASVDLAQVFQMLALNKKVGLLSIHSAKLWKVLYFDQRGVTVHHNVHRMLDRVVAAFVRSGRLTDEAVEEVRDHALRMGQPLADSLLAGGYVEAEELDYQYRLELEEEVYDLFFCRDAKFEFHENTTTIDGRDGTIDERFFFNCDSIIMEAARRIDEWAYISERIPSTAEVLVATVDAIDPARYGDDGPAILDLLDGRRNVARVVEITGLSNFLVCKTLSQLLDADAVAPVAPEELLPLASECMGEGRLQDAISLYERAVELGVGLPECHSLAAKAYQAAEQYELAIYHLSCEAEHRIGAGDLRGAAERLHEVKQLVPTDLQARERLVELTVGPDAVSIHGFDALAEGKELVDLLLEFGDIQRVRALLERLLLVEPNDPDLKKALVNVHIRAGDQKRVVQLYESIADDLVRQNKPLEAVAYLQKILLIDRSRTDVSERVRRLYEFDERARRRSRTLGVLAGTFFLLVVLGAGYWYYNERAEEVFESIDVHELVQHEDFAGAKAAYEVFLSEHPLTTAVAKAEAELQKIASAQQVYEARRASERAARERHLASLRDEYRAEWARHREQFLAGNPEVARDCVAKVRKLVDEAGAAQDLAWALEQQVERTWTNLEEFLAESQRLGVAYDERIAAGDWAAARELALQLFRDFEHTTAGRRARVPVTVVTRPAGATLVHEGKALMRTVDGKPEPVVTPGLVLCQPGKPVELVAELRGFEPRRFVVDGAAAGEFDVVLAVVPDRAVAFDDPLQTGVGVGEGWFAVGLRGGKLGLARTDGSNRQVRELPGLKAVEGTPRISGGRVFFLTNEGSIECYAVEPRIPVSGWPVQLGGTAATPLMVDEGRVAIVDSNGVLQCWEQASGHRLWSVQLGSAPSGPPTIDRRRVHVGTTDGRVLVFDATDGRSIGILRSPSGLTTRVHVVGGLLVFGCADEALRGVDFAAGSVVWSEALGRVPTDQDVATGATGVVALGAGRVVAIDPSTGAVRGQLALTDQVLGLRVQGARAYVQTRRARSRREPSFDTLYALDVETLALQWEHNLAQAGPGLLGADDLVVALPDTAQVVLFR